ncbi:hypothetical protein C0Z18_22405 [Trinickia dabaoshanensis]|uniref:Uncharacterized protein n=1 Tax=Trinickia dabaoshanensis TaxID=564714 RepID=A0A2N7VIB8_9BURK|nr:hypothetical protein [Trinickia dabaoshanensis]PMS16893.1 hypothetical protein C0Z18_22405 [Trinickia dabaoshanensis]
MDEFEEKVRLYRDRVAAFMMQAHGWCTARGLVVEEVTTELLEEALPKYEANSLHILTPDRQPLAELLPTGSAIIGALGRIDLRGTLARHAFLFQTGKGPRVSLSDTSADGKTSSDTPRPIISGIEGDGWYWYEAFIRRAKQVDENLFLDLLTDVSDYEFQ